jgi:hypothetical protein
MWIAQGDAFKALKAYHQAAICYERGVALCVDVQVLGELAMLYRDKITPTNMDMVLCSFSRTVHWVVNMAPVPLSFSGCEELRAYC